MISEFQRMVFKVSIEELITEREMMIAANKYAETRQRPTPYSEKAFERLLLRLEQLENELRNSF